MKEFNVSPKISNKHEIIDELKKMCSKKTMFQTSSSLLNKVNFTFNSDVYFFYFTPPPPPFYYLWQPIFCYFKIKTFKASLLLLG